MLMFLFLFLTLCVNVTVIVKRISCMQVISFCFSIFSHPKICIAHIEIPHEKSFKWRGIYSNATIWFGTYLSEKHASVTCQRFKFQFISMLMVNVCDWMFHFRSPPNSKCRKKISLHSNCYLFSFSRNFRRDALTFPFSDVSNRNCVWI